MSFVPGTLLVFTRREHSSAARDNPYGNCEATDKGMLFRRFVLAAAVGGIFVLCTATVVAVAQPKRVPLDLTAYRNKNRLVFVFAPDGQNKAFIEQTALWKNKAEGFAERDIAAFFVLEQGQSKRESFPLPLDDAIYLRRKFGVKPGTFRVLLVGKDGHTAFSSDHPVSLPDLFARIDAMPMRRDEMRRKQNKS